MLLFYVSGRLGLLKSFYPDMDILALRNFGAIQSNMDNEEQTFWAPVQKCVTLPKYPCAKMFQCWNVPVSKGPHAKISRYWNVPVPKSPCAEKFTCQIVHGVKMSTCWNVYVYEMSVQKRLLPKCAEISLSLFLGQSPKCVWKIAMSSGYYDNSHV